MKKLLLLSLLAVFFSHWVVAQDDASGKEEKGKFWKSWGVGLSGNFVDLNYFDDALPDDQRNLLDRNNLNLAGKLTLIKPLFRGLELGTSVALGDLENYGELNNFPVDERTFVDVDGILAARIVPLIDKRKQDTIRFDPFIYGSVGSSTLGTTTSGQFSVGAGINIWVKRNEFAIRLESSYNSQFDGQEFLQHSVGVYHAFQFKKIEPEPEPVFDTLIAMPECPVFDTLIVMVDCPPPPKPPVTVDEDTLPDPPIFTFIPSRVKFEFADSVLTPDSKDVLDTVAEIMLSERYKNTEFEIDGHTDNVDDHDHNMKLSLDRAVATANYLISKGVERSRLHPFGFGETKPLVKNNSALNRSINRRVEIHIYSRSPFHYIRKDGKVERREAGRDYYHPHEKNPYSEDGDARGDD